MQYCVYAHALSCTEHMSRKRIWSLKWQTKTKKKKLAIYRAWPWISNCWKWDSNSGLLGIESSALTTRPSRLGANLRRDATSRLLFLDQSVLADFDPRKKNPHFKTRSLSGTSNYLPVILSIKCSSSKVTFSKGIPIRGRYGQEKSFLSTHPLTLLGFSWCFPPSTNYVNIYRNKIWKFEHYNII